jgi:hypothetical protein
VIPWEYRPPAIIPTARHSSCARAAVPTVPRTLPPMILCSRQVHTGVTEPPRSDYDAFTLVSTGTSLLKATFLRAQLYTGIAGNFVTFYALNNLFFNRKFVKVTQICF